MRERIIRLKEELFAAEDIYCTERALIVTDSYRSNLDQTPILQRALAFRDILKKISIYVREDELLMGNLSSKLGARPLYPEFHIGLAEHSKTGSVGEQVPLQVYPELLEIRDFWNEHDSFHIIEAQRDPVTAWMQKELIINSAAEVNGHGHIVVDFEKILKTGFARLRSEIREKHQVAQTEEKRQFYESLEITSDAAINFAHRYTKLLLKLSEKEQSTERKKELQQLSVMMERIPAYPPQNFHEALQFIWFV